MPRIFLEHYGLWLTPAAREQAPAEGVPEHFLQCVWYDQLFASEGLATDEGCPLTVRSPGWWNHGAGPDFRDAQIVFGDTLKTGDVEVHLTHSAWEQHGHYLDHRYDHVMLLVVLADKAPAIPPRTSTGRRIPILLLRPHIDHALFEMAESMPSEEFDVAIAAAPGQCAEVVRTRGVTPVTALLEFAGDWRMLAKARSIRARLERVGLAQVLYENFLAACGFSRYKHHFRLLAQQLPYDRVRQLARQDTLLVETAFLRLCGLLPDTLPEGTTAVPHFARLRALQRDHLAGLRSLPLSWNRSGVRPTNYPERRLAGAAFFLSRTAAQGVDVAFEELWRMDMSPKARREAFSALFPASLGFWSTHCTWAGKKLARPLAMLGEARIRSIVGNVFVPVALALARQRKDRALEERVFEFYALMPGESENRVTKDMMPRMFGEAAPKRLSFRDQQGLIQIYQDWCETNPSCQGCRVRAFLDRT